MPKIPKRYGGVTAPASGWPTAPAGTENDRKFEARDLFRRPTKFISSFEVLVFRLYVIERALLADLYDDSQSIVDEIASLHLIERAAIDLISGLESLNGRSLLARLARHYNDFCPVEFVRTVGASGAVKVIAQSASSVTAGNVAYWVAHPGWDRMHPLTLLAQASAAERKTLEPHRAREDSNPNERQRVDPRRRLCDRACQLLVHLDRKDEINNTSGGLLHETMRRLWDRATGTKGFYAVPQHYVTPDTFFECQNEIERRSVGSSIYAKSASGPACMFLLQTHYGTCVYLNSAIRLRHGTVDENPGRVWVLITPGHQAILYGDRNCLRPLSFPCFSDGSLAGPTIDQDGSEVIVGVAQLFDIRGEGMVLGLNYRGIYLCSEPDGRIVLNRNGFDAWEQFTLIEG